MDALTPFAFALGSAWISGFRLYGCVATLGLLGRFGLVHLPGNMGVLTDWWVIGVAGALFLVEFFADKVPYLDTGWDAVHTFIRVPAGAVLAWSAYAHTDSRVQVIAALLGGGVALASHGTKAALRATVNTSPEPVSNWFLSLVEDLGAGVMTFLVAFLPIIAIFLVIGALVLSVLLMKKLFTAIKALFNRRKGQKPA